jgi:uncharacterized protein YneF (UPF0154 family)
MVALLVSSLVSLVIGVLTGLFFERRSTRAEQRKSEALRQELASLRHSVYSMGGQDAGPSKVPPLATEEVKVAVLERALAVQDSAGRVNTTALASDLVSQGYRPADVQQAIEMICEEHHARLDGKWMEMA